MVVMLKAAEHAVADADPKAVDTAVPAEYKDNADFKAGADAKAIYDHYAAAFEDAEVSEKAEDSRIAADFKTGVDLRLAADFKAAEDFIIAADLNVAQDCLAADFKVAEDLRLAADLAAVTLSASPESVAAADSVAAAELMAVADLSVCAVPSAHADSPAENFLTSAEDVFSAAAAADADSGGSAVKTPSRGSIGMRVKDRAQAKRIAASVKTADGFKVFADKQDADDPELLRNFLTPVKAATGKKVDKKRISIATASAIKATPEKIAVDRVAASVLCRAVYNAECDRLLLEFESKDAVLRAVVAVREAAHLRAWNEFKTARARLSVEELSFKPDERVGYMWATQSWKFTRQLQETVAALVRDCHEAVKDRTVAEERFDQKRLKLFEAAILAGTLDEAAQPPRKLRL